MKQKKARTIEMHMRVKEIRRTRLILAMVLLCAFALAPVAGRLTSPVAAAPLENPFKDTAAATTEPADTGNSEVTPTATADQTASPTSGDAGESAVPYTHEMTGETLPEWMLRPFDDPELKARVLTGSAQYGVVEAAERKSKIIPYSGGEMALKCYLSGSGMGRSQGFLLFINGIPQPYAIDRDKPLPGDDEYRFLHAVDIEDKESKADFTLRFTPVTGQKGDLLDFCVASVLHAGFVPKNPRQFAFAPYYRLFNDNYVLDFQATPEPINASEPKQDETRNHILTQVEVLQEDMSSEELAFATSQTGFDEFTQTQWEFSLNGRSVRGDPRLNLDQHEHLDFTFKLRGAPGRRWQVVLYLDHEPLLLGEKNHFALDVVRGQKNTLNFSLDPAFLHGVHTFYLVAMPVTEISAQGLWLQANVVVQTYPCTIYRAGDWRDWEPESP